MRVIGFARLLHQGDDATFDQQVGDYLDVDQFLRFLAVNVLLSNLDSFLGATQNHYIYLEPTSNKFQFLPWDMDHSFGVFPLTGTPESRRDLSIDHPGGTKHTLIERVLGLPRYKTAYHDYLDAYLEGIFAAEKLDQQISEAAKFLRPLVSANGPGARDRFERVVADSPQRGEPHGMKIFIDERRASVRRQLDGTSSGQILHDGEIKRFPVRKIIGFSIAMLLLMLVNTIGWLWSTVAGFRHNRHWGLLNMFFYPITPTVFGLRVRKDLGRSAACWTMCSVLGVVSWMVAAVVSFS
jgi:hypothetical protein